MPNTPDTDIDMKAALEEQKNYYRARAAEYDQWFFRQGRYDRGEDHKKKWFDEAGQVVAELETFVPYGDVLEFAGGTGIWSVRLANAAESLTVVDASEEMIQINRSKVGDGEAAYVLHDIFSFEPERRFDFVFFGFWLSHVPSERFEEFWDLVRRCLKPGGKFFFVDSVRESQSTAVDHKLSDEDDGETLVRKLNDGREFRIYKLFYQPQDLAARLKALGWIVNVKQTETFFLHGSGSIEE